MRREKFLAGIILSPRGFQPVFDSLRLGLAESGYAQGQVWALGRVFPNGSGHYFGLPGVGPAPAPVINRIRQVVIPETQGFPSAVRAGEHHQVVIVEFAIGNGDEGLVAAAVMPAQFPGRCPLTGEQSQDAFDVGGYAFFIV